MDQIERRLWELSDAKYREFQSKLIPNIDPGTVIGVRTPKLRSYAKELLRGAKKEAQMQEVVEAFMNGLPHRYFDENNLHGFLIEGIRDYGACVQALEHFLPYVDNWATCDQMSPKVLGKDKERLMTDIERWLDSGHVYTVRFGLGMLMRHYLDEDFSPRYLSLAAAKCCEDYYVNMMVAWYFATALAKQYEAALPFLEEQRLPLWTHNKAVQKAIESSRITPEQKAYLRTLKRK
ncbi:MAG: DNA alkylation repair protein [Muribaculaceae bacterium]|nr:DNA alkylation repair protein [Roseburia sp.]MCM1431605.1 DNA alkylation repair protein [Muribaculaceae bacterium]MCM1492070.1 DNA alkylation repair protein [Muribaculaceae bacterium]